MDGVSPKKSFTGKILDGMKTRRTIWPVRQ